MSWVPIFEASEKILLKLQLFVFNIISGRVCQGHPLAACVTFLIFLSVVDLFSALSQDYCLEPSPSLLISPSTPLPP